MASVRYSRSEVLATYAAARGFAELTTSGTTATYPWSTVTYVRDTTAVQDDWHGIPATVTGNRAERRKQAAIARRASKRNAKRCV
jgi:hypothetical protein